MAGGTYQRPVHPGTGSPNEAPEPTDGKRRLIRGEGSVARISNDYRPQLPVVGKDIPGPAVPCHVGTARSLETGTTRTRSVGRAVRHPYSDSEESDNEVLYAYEHDDAVQHVSLCHNRLTPTGVDSCDEGCAQLDDFNWFVPADVRAGDLPAPESEIEESDSEAEPDLTQLQTDTWAQQLLGPPVVAQTRPMEGCSPALPRRSRRGRDVLTEDGAGAVDTERVSAASDAVVSWETHLISVHVPTVVPKLAAAPQAASVVVQPRPPDSDLLPPVGECWESVGLDTPDAGESGMEVAGGSPPAEIDIHVNPDMLQTEISVTTQFSEMWMVIDSPDTVESGMIMVGGSPPAEVDISINPDVQPTAISVTTEVSEIWMEIDFPDTLESGMEMVGGSPPAEVDISENPDVLPIARSVMTEVSEKWMEISTPDTVESGMEVAGGSPPAEVDISVGPDVLPTVISVTTVVSEKWMERFVVNLDMLCSDGLVSDDDPEKVQMSAVMFVWFRIRDRLWYPCGQ